MQKRLKGVSMTTPKLLCRMLAGVALLCAAAAVPAQTGKPLRVIVPYGTGTGADIISRLVGSQLTERIKDPVIIDNRPGNGSIIGVNALKNAAPDGSTIGVLVSANAAQPWLVKDLPFDLRKDFVPLTILYAGPLVLTVNVNLPVRTLAELVGYARANPSKVFYGSLGAGTTTHLAAEMLKQVANIQMTHVPFKGSGEIHTAVASGEIQMSFDNYISPRPLVDAGKLRLIASTGKARSTTLPNVPVLGETYPGVELGFWTGFAAPAGTSRDHAERIGGALRAVLALPEVRRKIAETGSEPGGGSAAEFATLIEGDVEKFGRIIRGAGIKPE